MSNPFLNDNTRNWYITAVGTYTSSITGTGNYTGTVNGGTLTINAAPAPTGSVAEINRITATQVQLQATLTGATATGYSWSKIGGSYGGAVGISGFTLQTCTVTANAAPTGSNSIIQCIISYSGGSVSPNITVTWGLI